jgi:hypothetical protein
MKILLHYVRRLQLDTACWLLACGLMIPLRRSGFFDQPTVLLVCYACLAVYGFRVLVPFAFGSRKLLAENAETIGTSNPWVARITCSIAMVAVFAGFTTVVLLTPEVSIMVRLGDVLGVVAGGVLLLRRAKCKPEKVNCS